MELRIRHNIAILGLVKIFNYIIPLITLPYLTYTLGLDTFGKVAFAQIFSAYFIIITEYGFSWSATRKISEHRLHKEIVLKIFSNVWWSQWLLALFSMAIAITFIYSVPIFRQNATYLLTTIPAIIASVCMPIWLLQGLERTKEIAAFQLSSRLLTVPALFILIKSSEDGHLVPLINSATTIIAGCVFLFLEKKRKTICLKPPALNEILIEIKDGSDLFFIKLVISIYTTLPPILLGTIAGTAALGLFNLADKIRQVVQSSMEPISQALFPRMSHLYKYNYSAAHRLLKISIIITTAISSTTSFILWFFSEKIIILFGGSDFISASPILKWLSFIPLFIGLSNIFGIQVMLANNLKTPFNKILAFTSLLSLPLSCILIKNNNALGAAQTFFICEMTVTLLMAIYLMRNGYFKEKNEI